MPLPPCAQHGRMTKLPPSKRRLLGTAAVIGLCLLVVVGLWHTQNEPIAVTSRPRAVVGTDCTLVAIVPRHRRSAAGEALRNAEAVLRQIEGRMSSWIDVSEIGKLNAGDAEKRVAISPETRYVLQAARDAFDQTDGAFDTTCRLPKRIHVHLICGTQKHGSSAAKQLVGLRSALSCAPSSRHTAKLRELTASSQT